MSSAREDLLPQKTMRLDCCPRCRSGSGPEVHRSRLSPRAAADPPRALRLEAQLHDEPPAHGAAIRALADVCHLAANAAGRATHSKRDARNASAADPDTSIGEGHTSAHIPHDQRQAAGPGTSRPMVVGELIGRLTANKIAGQRPFSREWQVQDSNLRRHTPTDLQSSAHNVVTCGFVAHHETSSRIPHDQRRIVDHNRTRPDSSDLRCDSDNSSGCSTCSIAGLHTTEGSPPASPQHQSVDNGIGV